MQFTQDCGGLSRSFTARSKRAVEHQVDAVHSGCAQVLVLTFANMDSAALQQLLVELLQTPGGQLLQFDVADAGNRSISLPR